VPLRARRASATIDAGIMEPLFTTQSSPTWIVTDAAGNILEVSPSAAEMLNVTRLHLRRRSLLNFFASDRPEWNRLLRLAGQGHNVRRAGAMRPRDRRPCAVEVELVEVPRYPGMQAFEWRFTLAQIDRLRAAG
jgi:PAS domain S-box-containing protein